MPRTARINKADHVMEDAKSDPQAHIHHNEANKVRANFLTAATDYEEASAVPIQKKDILIQEAHHRIKNSLQLVQSLLNLQAKETTDEVASRQLYDSAARVRVIGAMHDRLYRSETMLEVEVKPYLKALVKDLSAGLASATSDRLILLHADNAILPAADIPTLGLVLTELVTNSLKYGAGNINIYFYQELDQQAVLIVEDEGTLAPNFDLTLNSGFGIKLIQTLIGQRDGSIIVNGVPDHTRFIVVMPRLRNATGVVKIRKPMTIVRQAEGAAA